MEAGSARVFSGADGTEIHAFYGAGPSEWLGYSVDGAGEVNGDGFADLIVGALGDSRGLIPGSATVYFGKTGAVLFRRYGQDKFDKLGHSVSGAGDMNGDGYGDLLVGAPVGHGSFDLGYSTVYSSRHGLLLSAPSTQPTGSRLDYSIATQPPRPGIPYFFDLSISGNANGPILGARRFPLTPPFLKLSSGANSPGLFCNFVGTLNSNGEAIATLVIPAIPALAGLTVYGAALTVDATMPGNFGISNGVKTKIR